MRIEELSQCRICGNEELIEVIDLGSHALSGRFPSKDEADPPKAPLVLVKCDDSKNSNNCGLLQLKHKVPGEELYFHDYGYRSGINKTMTNHLHGVVKEIENLVSLTSGEVIVDIGSNDATFLKAYSVSGLIKIGIDPTGKQFQQFYTSDIKLVPDFFDKEKFLQVSPDKKAKVITSIAMFYDLPDPMKFVNDVKDSLDQEGIWVFEQSYMPFMLETKSFDTICHEHLEYYALKQIKWMMDKANLKIIDVNFNDTNGGSFRITVCHKNSKFTSDDKKINDILAQEKEMGLETLEPYIKFRNEIENTRNSLVNFLKKEKSLGKSIYVYGASTKGNTLLQHFGLDAQLITAAAERNPEKYGKRTPLTNIPIISEDEARKAKPDYFVVLPWHFKEEFLQREKPYLESGGNFVFPLPEFEVVGNQQLLKNGSN